MLNKLDLGQFPATSRYQFPEGEWLNILSLMKKEDQVYLHTNGGAATRSKSGPDYEFSVLSVLDRGNNLLRNVDIEEGKGCFSTDKKYFILHPRKNKRELLFYNLENMEAEFKVPISELNKSKSNSMVIDIYGNKFFVYGKNYLHIRKLTW